jgi:hypothetical protein
MFVNVRDTIFSHCTQPYYYYTLKIYIINTLSFLNYNDTIELDSEEFECTIKINNRCYYDYNYFYSYSCCFLYNFETFKICVVVYFKFYLDIVNFYCL